MTAVRGWLSSSRLCLIAATLLAVSGCAAVQQPAGTGGAASEVRTATVSPVATPGKGGSPSPVAGVVDPSVSCTGPFTGTVMVFVGAALYDVTDPVHPRLVCLTRNTSVQLFTADTFEYIRRSGPDGTEVVLHSIGSGNERVVAGWPLKLMNLEVGGFGTWTPDGNNAATFVASTDADGNQTIQVWLFAEPNKTELYEFRRPLTDCICRFGLPSPTLAFSADGQYLVAGWPIGKGAEPMRVYRVADATRVETLDIADAAPVWSRTGHRLFLGPQRQWTPEDGITGQTSSGLWSLMRGLSPDGAQIAFTGYADATSLRVWVYGFEANQAQMLIDQPRSEVTFVKDGWVWYWGELPCGDCPGGSAASGPVYAMQVGTGVEAPVVFQAGDSPVGLQSSWGPGVFWPNS
jgi:hypothetical protein